MTTAQALKTAQTELATLEHIGAPMGTGKYAHAAKVRALKSAIAEMTATREQEKFELLSDAIISAASQMRFVAGSTAEITRQHVLAQGL